MVPELFESLSTEGLINLVLPYGVESFTNLKSVLLSRHPKCIDSECPTCLSDIDPVLDIFSQAHQPRDASATGRPALQRTCKAAVHVTAVDIMCVND